MPKRRTTKGNQTITNFPMGRTISGRKWRPDEILQRKEIMDSIRHLYESKAPKKWYLENEQHLNAFLAKKDRTQLLKLVAQKSKTRLPSNATEKEILYSLFKRPLPPKKLKQGKLELK